jgi:hypothetical protein
MLFVVGSSIGCVGSLSITGCVSSLSITDSTCVDSHLCNEQCFTLDVKRRLHRFPVTVVLTQRVSRVICCYIVMES